MLKELFAKVMKVKVKEPTENLVSYANKIIPLMDHDIKLSHTKTCDEALKHFNYIAKHYCNQWCDNCVTIVAAISYYREHGEKK